MSGVWLFCLVEEFWMPSFCQYKSYASMVKFYDKILIVG